MGWTALIVDDHESFRSGARALLEAGGFEVLGEAATGEAALEQVAVLHPDLVLLDIQLPGMNGFKVAEELARQQDPPAVVLISTRDASDYGPRLRRVPARGFISKGELTFARIVELIGAA